MSDGDIRVCPFCSIILIIILLPFLSGCCFLYGPSVYTFKNPNVGPYEPTEKVKIIRKEFFVPEQEYEKLAAFSVTKNIWLSWKRHLKALEDEGKKIGADAIIIEATSEIVGYEGEYSSHINSFGFGLHERGTIHYKPVKRDTIIGVAIRYIK
jgi:hypothetical protein